MELEYPVRVGVVGCRYCNDYAIIKKELDALHSKTRIDLIVSGGAKGVDTLAEKWARENNIPCKVYLPNLAWGKKGYAMRNQQIVDLATHLLAFPSEQSKGTLITINMAKKSGIPVNVIKI